MTKFLALGLTLPEVIGAATVAPADAMRRPELGRLAPGAAGRRERHPSRRDPHRARGRAGRTSSTATQRLVPGAW